jgi:hypothetical protein
MIPGLMRPFLLVVFAEAIAHSSTWHVVFGLLGVICIARPTGWLVVMGCELVGLRVVRGEMIALVVVVIIDIPVIAARMWGLVRVVSAFISIRCVALLGRV